ncbi:hypothetical protein ACOMHN_008534 [Nucella lapillus]
MCDREQVYTCLGYNFNISNTAPLHLPGLQLQHQQHSATTPAWATASTSATQRHYTCLGYNFNISNSATTPAWARLQHQQHSATTHAWGRLQHQQHVVQRHYTRQLTSSQTLFQ